MEYRHTRPGIVSAGAGIGFQSVAAPEATRNQARFDIEADHRVNRESMHSASLHAATGGDTPWHGSVSWKHRF